MPNSVLQVLGRTHRANGKTMCASILSTASDTVEENICENMKEKITNIALIK